MRAALEAALVDNPDDRATHMAYADWLAEQGDPRGELIQVQLALEDETRPAEERKRLQQREQELLEAHQREWLGGLATYLLGPVPEGDYDRDSPGNYLFRFARGWLHSLTCRQLHVAVARAVARAPEVRLLRQFAIEYVYWYDRPHEHYEEGPDLEGVDPNYPGRTSSGTSSGRGRRSPSSSEVGRENGWRESADVEQWPGSLASGLPPKTGRLGCRFSRNGWSPRARP